MQTDSDSVNSDNTNLMYTGNSINKSNFASSGQSDFWNREHVCQSHGTLIEGDWGIRANTDVIILKSCRL